MKATKGKDNPFERAVRSKLFRKGLRFRVHAKVVPGTARTVDIAFVRPKLAVFLDGCFWHGCPQHTTIPKRNREFWLDKIAVNRARDLDTAKRLVEAGWKVKRFWQHQAIDEIAASVAISLSEDNEGQV